MIQNFLSLDFQWDSGNWPKCGKHGLSKADIESLFGAKPHVRPAQAQASESRQIAVGQLRNGRYAFVVFTIRAVGSTTSIRPLSARYMHDKEVRHYESR